MSVLRKLEEDSDLTPSRLVHAQCYYLEGGKINQAFF